MTTDTAGGVWNYALELARELGRENIAVILVALGPELTAYQRQEARRIENIRLRHRSCKLEWMDDPWTDLQNISGWLLELEKKERPDIVHLNEYSFGTLPWQTPTLMVGHSCVYTWYRAVYGKKPPPVWEKYRHIVSAGLQSADFVVSPSHSMLSSLVEMYGELNAAAVIYNGRRATDFMPGVKEQFIFSAGRIWDEGKNIAVLERIASKISWPIHIIGNTLHPNGKEIEFCCVHARKSMPQKELADWYARAAIYILPARYEPFGMTVLEAALAGCALVLGDIPSLHEIWGACATYVPPGDPDAIARKVQFLIDHPMLRRKLSRMARFRALELTPERMADQYIERYRMLLEMVRIPHAGKEQPKRELGIIRPETL
jgi:glycosyltransferase involved in cell wall biosynthesis